MAQPDGKWFSSFSSRLLGRAIQLGAVGINDHAMLQIQFELATTVSEGGLVKIDDLPQSAGEVHAFAAQIKRTRKRRIKAS